MREKIAKLLILLIGLALAAGLIFLGFRFGAFDFLPGCAGAPAPADEKQPLVPAPARHGQLSVYFIDVGQGDAAVLVSPAGKTMLIDAGESIYAGRVARFLGELGVQHIDVLVATHAHSDHIGAMPQLIRRFSIGGFVTTAVTAENVYSAALDAALTEKGVKTRAVWSGETIEWDESCSVTVLSPVLGCEYSQSDLNDGCLMLRVEYGGTAFIFTADATVHAEQLSMFHNEKELFEANVLKVAHHGSTTSSSLGFVETVGAETAVISVGAKNPYGHPDFDVVNRLKSVCGDILRTDELGAIAVFSNGETLEYAFQKPRG
ncbi:MAG: MBL fold metallo-hydrolase [Clostridia bacterium]|nr:MBL fold metallo-hydrolase [Clostridia bacterium]